MKKVFLFLLFLLLNACAVYTSGYMPLVKEPRIPYTEQHQKKYDLTFSIGSLGTSPKFEAVVIKEIKEFFGKTHLFNKIHYIPFKEKSSRHIHFDFIYAEQNPQEAMNLGFISGYTLTAFPVWISQYVDINMLFYINRKERLALSVAEKEKIFIWLPLIILTPAFNPISVEARIRENAFKYFLNAIIEEKLYE